MNLLRKWSVLGLTVLCLVGSSFNGFAQEDPQINEVMVTVTADGFEFPAEVPSGIVSMTFDNQSEAPIMPVPARLEEDVTQEQLMETLMTEGEEAALEIVSLHGGMFMLPGTTTTVTYDFAAGNHALFDFAAEQSEPLWFTVAEGTETEADEIALEADVEVLLQDFAFAMPTTIPSGESMWYMENQGGQWHEMVIIHVEDGTTLEEATAMLAEQMAADMGAEATEPAGEAGAEATEEAEPTAAMDTEATEEPAGAEATEMATEGEEEMPDFMWMPMEEGERAWFPVNLEPGTYMVVCGLPNLEEMQAGEAPHAHYELGMITIITVE
jgi:hypothetical protein